jgi:hypothetical protein
MWKKIYKSRRSKRRDKNLYIKKRIKKRLSALFTRNNGTTNYSTTHVIKTWKES